MIETLEHIDRTIVLLVNSGNHPFLDEVMWVISGKLTWIPLYLLLVYWGYRKLELRPFMIYFLCVVVAVILADVISSQLIKELVARYRPSHHALLRNQLHFYVESNGNPYMGGQYGFVSSHAANFFALAVSAGLVLRKFYPHMLKILLIIAVIVSFSRIYLGVHYLSDIIGGAAIGATLGWFMYRFVFSKLTVS